MKKFLQELISKKEKRMAEIKDLIQASENIDEVRSLGAEKESLETEINEARTKLNDLKSAEFNPLGSYGEGSTRSAEEQDVEYRTAFMNYVTSNVAIPAELRADANTKTTDVGAVIPTNLVNRIIERMEQSGMILSRVTRTAFAGGVSIPTSSVKPTATWVNEGDGSDRQKKTTSSVTFSYFKLRCEISMSMEVGAMALSAFEAKFVENVAKAMVIAIEKAILNGAGTASPKGLLQETGTPKTIAAAVPTYAEALAIEAAVPVEYEESAVWLMTKAQFFNFLAMTDEAGQPIARVNYGIAGKPERTILGREVIVHPYATEMGSNVGVIVDLADYVLNTIYDMGITKKQDWETEDLLTKAVMSCDGKLVDKTSLIKVTITA